MVSQLCAARICPLVGVCWMVWPDRMGAWMGFFRFSMECPGERLEWVFAHFANCERCGRLWIKYFNRFAVYRPLVWTQIKTNVMDFDGAEFGLCIWGMAAV